MQTLRQLLPPQAFARTRAAGVSWTVPAVDIVDYPRFSWRGTHLDVGRHFMPVTFVKKFIDLLAAHKLNRFHWHLTEDQGWRLEIKRYPRLTSVGAWRRETIIGYPRGDSTRWRYDRKRHGGFYTQEQVREVVAYAAERFVLSSRDRMPGHAKPRVAYRSSAYRDTSRLDAWGISNKVSAEERPCVHAARAKSAGYFRAISFTSAARAPKTAVATSHHSSRIRELGLFGEGELQVVLK